MTASDHARFLALAVAEATRSVSTSGGPFGAVVVKDGVVLATASNRVTLDLDPTAHAEVVAIRAACRALSDFALRDCTLYSSCEPCPLCLSASYWARLDAIYFAAGRDDAAAAGFDDAFLYAELAKPIAKRALPLHRIAIPEAQQPFEAWNANAARREY